MSRRGGALELALARAGRWYRRNGRKVVLVRQYPDVATDGEGAAFYSSGAPVDFMGCLDGRALALEAKETKTPSLALSRLREDQRTLMGMLDAAGADARLVVGFTGAGEVYAVPYPDVAAFIATAWRASWSLAWCRAHGLLLPEDDADEADRRKVLFLDGASHPERAAALEDVAAEQARAAAAPRGPAAPPDDAELAAIPWPPPSPFRGLTPDQIRDRLRGAVATGVDRQLAAPRRRLKGRTRRRDA